MTTEVVAVIVAVLSAVFSLASAVTLEVSRRRSAHKLEKMRYELSLDRENRMLQRSSAELVLAYQNPILRSAYDLQSRIYNLHRGFRGRRDPEYFKTNTLYLVAEFFGWLEIVRREMQFLDLTTEADSSRLKEAIDRVQDRFASTSRRDDVMYIYRGQQRAIGELMIVDSVDSPAQGVRSRCLGYANFVERLGDPSFAKWFDRIGSQLINLSVGDLKRLIGVQHALIDLIDLLDYNHARFPANRAKIDPID